MKFDYFLQNRTILNNGYASLSPQVSIVMPTYSRMAEGFLAKCIDSVLAQTFQNFEFIIIDDGSVDGSQGLITAYANKDSRIVYVRHDENSGLPAVRTNEGILLARASYVSFIFDDNVWESEALSLMMENMMKDPVDVLHANTRMIQNDNSNFDLGGWPLSIELLQHLNTIPNGAVLCSRSFFEHHGMYDPHLGLRRVCDWDLWLRSARFGAKFRHLNMSLGIELGPSSPVSLGNSVTMDYKVVFAYMADEAQIKRRSEALTPKEILHYDVFDPLKIFPYIRNETEWQAFQNSVYKPFFDTHPKYREATPVIHNRLYDSSEGAYFLNANGSIFKDKKRALIVCNRFTPFVEDWKSSFESGLGAITVTCSEWQASAFSPEELDYLVLIDCAALFLKPFVEECREQNVAIGYVVMHGMDTPAPDVNPLQRLAFSSHNSIWETFKTDIYFPHFGVPWSDTGLIGVNALMKMCHQVFVIGRDAGVISIFPGIDGVGLPYLPKTNFAGEILCDIQDSAHIAVTFYLGSPTKLHQSLNEQIAKVAKALKRNFAVKLHVLNESEVPDPLSGAPELQDCLYISDEALLTWARRHQAQGVIIVPDVILDQLSEYFLHFLEDDLAEKKSALLRFSELPAGEDLVLDASWIADTLASKLKSVSERQAITQEGCRLTQFACAASSLLLQRDLQSEHPRAGVLRVAVLLNSPLLSGSEAYGLLLVKAFARLGFEVVTCVPNQHGYGEVSPVDINLWLKMNGLTEAKELSYGLSTQCFDLPAEQCVAHSRSFNEWMDQQNIHLVLCSGFIPDPVLARSKANRPVFMALFQPWGYPLEKMTFLRDRVAGILTDSEWSASHWARWLPPPVRVVPTALPSRMIKRFNESLGPTPICIAVGGTLQPRKRQREAIEAVRDLLAEGYDIKLNIYGYELAIVSEYLQEIRQLVDSNNLGKVVELHGLVEMEQIARNNHIILSASIDESLPQTLLFTMAAGLVAVACPAGGVPEIVIDGKTGYLCEGFATSDVKAGIKRAINNRQEWPKIQAQAVAHLRSQHGELNVSKRLLMVLIEGLAIEKSRGRRMFPMVMEQGEGVSVPTYVTPLQRLTRTLRPLKRKLLQGAKRLIKPYLSWRMKKRIMHIAHRLGLL